MNVNDRQSLLRHQVTHKEFCYPHYEARRLAKTPYDPLMIKSRPGQYPRRVEWEDIQLDLVQSGEPQIRADLIKNPTLFYSALRYIPVQEINFYKPWKWLFEQMPTGTSLEVFNQLVFTFEGTVAELEDVINTLTN